MRVDILCDNSKIGDELIISVKKAIANLGILADVHIVRERDKMMELGVSSSPAILIDKRLEIYNKIPDVKELEAIFKRYES